MVGSRRPVAGPGAGGGGMLRIQSMHNGAAMQRRSLRSCAETTLDEPRSHCLDGRVVPPGFNAVSVMAERTNPRHPSFDYRSVATYFVTVCTHNRACLFGTVRRGRMVLNEYGQIVAEEWVRSEKMRGEVVLDAFVVMPTSTGGRFTKRSGVNHLHGIVCLVPPEVDDVSPRGYDLHAGQSSISPKNTPYDDVGSHRNAALREREGHPRREEGGPQRHAKSLGSMIAGVKGAVTTRINRSRESPGEPVWQTRYHDRILRNEDEWRARRRYIERNPGRWTEDRHHPSE